MVANVLVPILCIYFGNFSRFQLINACNSFQNNIIPFITITGGAVGLDCNRSRQRLTGLLFTAVSARYLLLSVCRDQQSWIAIGRDDIATLDAIYLRLALYILTRCVYFKYVFFYPF